MRVLLDMGVILDVILDWPLNRPGALSTLITSQLPIKAFYAYLNEPTIADAFLFRRKQWKPIPYG